MLVSDTEFLFIPTEMEVDGKKTKVITMHASIQRPLSKGWVKLSSADPFAPPLINPDLLSDKMDVSRLKMAVKMARKLASTAPLAEFIEKELIPTSEAKDEESFEKLIRNNAQSQWHICGSCKMGIDKEAVVNPDLEVIGIKNLRIADSSIMPTVVTGHAQSSIFIIAEKVCEMIIKKYSN